MFFRPDVSACRSSQATGRPAVERLARGFMLGCLLMSMTSVARAQMSPGPLAAPHQELDTSLKCFVCHGEGKGLMRDRCLACHEEIAWLVQRGLGLHGRKGAEKCSGCHPDHAGRDFAMIAWEEKSPERFDHRRSGWPLEVRHAPLKCADCHKPQFQVSEALRLSKRKGKEAAWLGLDRACQSCHTDKDVHRGALGKECAKCHDANAWKPALQFDHAKTDFPLTGKHAPPVACEKCHLAASLKLPVNAKGQPIPLYKPLPHKQCSACHADPHAGQLGPACSKCHDTAGWKRVDPKAFNHDLTHYPLRGRHARVECARCHDPRTAWGKKPPFATCGACHADAHAGQATLAGKIADCAACHNVEGFKPSTYTVAQHKTSAYPLVGKHETVKCEACHRKNPPGVATGRLGTSGVLMRMARERCRDCHSDDHGGQLAARPDRGACEPCHRVEGWKPSTFTARDHAKLKLGLAGKHNSIPCAACHGPTRKGLPPLPGPEAPGKAGVAVVLKDPSCVACHFDPHEGRFAPQGARPQKAGCVTCHNFRTFHPSTVDVAIHRSFGYPLDGAHRATPCDTCHAEVKAPPVRSSLVLDRGQTAPMLFTMKDSRCEACHQSPHGNQFARRRDRGACKSCHDEESFRPASRFDHTRDAVFSLEGAHARVACNLCHPARKDSAGRKMVVYQPIPKDCKSCHGERAPGKLTRLAPGLTIDIPAHLVSSHEFHGGES